MDLDYAKHILKMNMEINTKYGIEENEDKNYNQLMSLATAFVLDSLEEKDKMINAMAEYLAQVRECPYEDFEVDLDCDKRCDNTDETLTECWKMYFERKVKNGRKKI